MIKRFKYSIWLALLHAYMLFCTGPYIKRAVAGGLLSLGIFCLAAQFGVTALWSLSIVVLALLYLGSGE